MNRRSTLRTIDVQNAIRRAKEMFDSALYSIKPAEAEEGRTIWLVANKEDFDRSYFVETTPGAHNCTCPQFERAGVCKHEYYALDHEEHTSGEVRTATRHTIAAGNAAALVGAGIWDTTTNGERAQTAHNEGREIAYFANQFNDRIF